MSVQLELPVSRIVWGHPTRAQIKKDQQTKQVIMKDGKPVEQRVMGVAIPKQEFMARVWPAMEQEIRTGFPQGMPPQFSGKYKDGDGLDRAGKPYNTREGYAGHYVLTISSETGFPPPMWKWDAQRNQYVQIGDTDIKCGDFIVPTIEMKLNVPQNKAHTPGLYINPRGILFVGYGQEIVNQGGDPTEMFGQQPRQYQLPPGASYTPLAPNPGAAPPMGGQPPQQQYAPQGQQPGPQGYAPPPMGQPGPQQSFQPAPGGYAPQPGGPISSGTYAPQQQMPGQYPPATDFVQNAGQQPPQGQPGGYAPPPMGQPGPQQYAPQPGQQMPGGYQPPAPGNNYGPR